MNNGSKRELQLITFHLQRKYVEVLNRLVMEGYFSSRAEALRFAVILLIKYTRELERKQIHRLYLG